MNKLLLTSAGVRNPSIRKALLELLGKPIADCHALCIPTARSRATTRRLAWSISSIFPHLDYPGWDDNTMAAAERWAAVIGGPAFAIDDQTAIKVVGGKAEVVSEGNWRFFAA